MTLVVAVAVGGKRHDEASRLEILVGAAAQFPPLNLPDMALASTALERWGVARGTLVMLIQILLHIHGDLTAYMSLAAIVPLFQ